jgi:hypothetical protein
MDEERVVAAFRKLTDKSLRKLLADRSGDMGFPRELPLLEVSAGLGVVAVCFQSTGTHAALFRREKGGMRPCTRG